MKTQVILSVVVGLLLLLIVFANLHDWTQDSQIDESVLNKAPLIISHGVKGRVYAKDGQLKYTLQAVQAEDFDTSSRVHLVQPHIVIHNDESHWDIHAKQGKVQLGGGETEAQIILLGQVKANLSGEPGAKVTSDELHYFPDRKVIVSPGQVFIRRLQNTLQAGEMHADLITGRLQLSQGVESHYAVPAS